MCMDGKEDETMNERNAIRMELYDKVCAILTDYEGNGSEYIPNEADLYEMLVEVQRAFDCGII